jgi:4-amino-4-deoxy-L-arabinose transferase-like glycosyltransferase
LPRLGAAIVDHAAFVTLVLVGAVVRIATVIAYRPALLLQRDAIAYLHTALASNASPNSFRPALYSLLFLRPLLFFDELVVVTVVQHALGIGIAIAVYMFMLHKQVHPVIAGVAMAPFLLDGYQVNIEHYVLTEAFFGALVVAALLLVAWATNRPPLVACAVAGALLGVAGLTRFVGLVLIVPVLVYLLWRRVGWLRVVALIAAFAIPVLAYSAWSRSATGSAAVTSRYGFFLYGRVSSFSDCRVVELPRRLERYCFKRPPEDRPPIHGFWGLEPIRARGDDPDTNGELLEFARRIIAAQPLDYAGAVTADFMQHLAPGPPISKEPLAAKWRFPREVAEVRPNPAIVRLKGSAPPRMGFDRFEIERPIADRLRSYQDVVYTRGPLLAVLLALGAIGAVIGRPMREGSSARADAILFTLAAVALLLAPVMVTVYHFRYSLPAVPLACAAAGIGAGCIHARWAGRAREPTASDEHDDKDDSRGGEPVSSVSHTASTDSPSR